LDVNHFTAADMVGVHRAIGSISCSGCLNTIGSRAWQMNW